MDNKNVNKQGNSNVNSSIAAAQAAQGNKVLIAFVGGLIIGFLAAFFWFGGDSNTSDDGKNNGGENATSTEVSISRLGGNAIFVSNQEPGESVEVGLVRFENPGFVVIQEDNDGTPGRVIGSKLFTTNDTKGTIELNESTVEGGTYHAVLWDDNGDNKFVEADDVAIPKEGGVLMSTFKTGQDYELQEVSEDTI